CMQWRGVQDLDVVQRDRWIDQETKHTGAEHVPESHSHEEHDRPAQIAHPAGLFLHLPVMEGFVTQHDQGHHFQGTEGSANGHDRCGRTREVQVMQSTGHTANQEQRGGSQTGNGGTALGNQTQGQEDKAHGNRGEDLEEALNPQVNHPPAPVLHDGDIGVLAVEQTGTVEQANGHGRDGQQNQQVVVALVTTQSRPHATQHQQQPECQANKLDDLPETAQIQVLIALVTEPEVQLGWQDVLDGQEVAGKRTNKEHNQSTEQDIHTQTLELGIFTPVNQWHQEQAGGQETTGNPQESRLNMPGTGQRVREPLRHVYAIEHLAFNRVVRGKAAQENLDDKQGNRQEGIFFQGTLRRCQAESQNRVGSRGNRRFLFFVRKGPDPDQQANTGQQEHDTDDGPDDIGRGWMVIHQGLVWPVVGIADSSAGTLGYRGPGQPEEKAGHVLTTLQLWQGVVLHGEAF